MHLKHSRFLVTGLALLLHILSAQAQVPTLFTSLPSAQTGVNFRNDIYEDDRINYFVWEYLYNGGGVAVGDINQDGLQDIYFSSTTGYNKLYLNLGHLKFKDITDAAGVSGGQGIKTGVNMVDINNDGWPDIYVSKSGPFPGAYRQKLMYINNHDGTFTDRAKEMGLDDSSYTTQSYFLDYDRDGDLDLFLVDYPHEFQNTMVLNAQMVNGKLQVIDEKERVNVSHRLLENRNGHFVDVSAKAGISTYAYGLSAMIGDFNADGWPDIYVAHDFKKPDALYINNKNGTFTDRLTDYFEHISGSSMGSDMCDVNNDGLEDVFTGDMAMEDPLRQKQLFVQHLNYDKFQLMVQYGLYYQYPRNAMQMKMPNGRFADISYHAGLAETDWSWAPLWGDWDNDGWRDLYITNGYRRDVSDWDYREFTLDSIKNVYAQGKTIPLSEWFKLIHRTPLFNYFCKNNGTFRFTNTSREWCDEPASWSSGAAYADLDNDGDLDLVVNNIDAEAFVLENHRNETPGSHYLRFRFANSPQNPGEPYGTLVKLTDSKGGIQLQHYDPQRGYMSTMEHFLHFGFPNGTEIVKAEITYPSGKVQIIDHPKADQVISLFASDGQTASPPPPPAAAVFTNLTSAKKLLYKQTENDFIDFKREPLIPYKCSRKGPYYAKGDINGDGRADLFIGGSAGTEGQLMIQNADGSFTARKLPVFTKDKAQEDNGAVFFDADGDKDLDLYVSSGGAEFPAGSPLYQDRLYLNDGKGNFTAAPNALPKETNNNTCVIAFDYDGDGDLDIFSGGGVKPGQFPRHDHSMILQNNKGVFTDVSAAVAPGIDQSGLINSAAWADIDGDKKPELILSGEWMPVTILHWNGSRFENQPATVKTKTTTGADTALQMQDFKGWWYSVIPVDVDGDGDLDLVAGNRGTNSRIQAGLNEPCTVYAKDFDGNGSYDAVLGFYVWGKCYPMYHRDQLIDQMPMMRKKFYRYSLYTGTTLENLFTPEQQKGMDTYSVNCFESGVFINDGNHQFHFEAFPEWAQLSNINDFLPGDFDKDGITDLIAVGNSDDPEIGTGNYDAMAALFLKGLGNGKFEAVLQSGLNERGEVRRILKEGEKIILLKNSGAAAVYK